MSRADRRHFAARKRKNLGLSMIGLVIGRDGGLEPTAKGDYRARQTPIILGEDCG
jgi:hypothetical protein